MHMQTQSSPPQSTHSKSGALQINTESKVLAVHWSEEDESAFVDFLIIHKAEAGDGLNFKPSVWAAAAQHMWPFTMKGGSKDASQCKAKWGRVCHNYFGYFAES